MLRPMVRIHNSQTNEIIDREMNDDEYQQFLEHQKRSKAELEAQKSAAAKREALLEKLGITEEEAKLLLS